MPEPTKPTLTGFIHDMGRAAVAFASLIIMSIPLALAFFMALALWILPEAFGAHQSGAHILSELGRSGAPHALFSITKDLFVMSWVFAVFAKLLDMAIRQRRFREKRRNILRDGDGCGR